MDREELLQDLARLRTELARLETRETRARARLESLIDDLEFKLEHPDDEEHHHNLVARVRSAVEEFEVEHPRATGILNQVMMTLSNLGI